MVDLLARARGDLAERQPEIALARQQFTGGLENSLLGLKTSRTAWAVASVRSAADNRAT
jgi:hypothetical protein